MLIIKVVILKKIDIENLSVKVPEDFFTNINLKSEREALEKKLEELQV